MVSIVLSAHFPPWRTVLERLMTTDLKIMPNRIFYLRRSVGFLDHLISFNGIGRHAKNFERSLAGTRRVEFVTLDQLLELRLIENR